MKVLNYTKYVYLIVAALSIYKIIELWDKGTESYIFIAFAVVSLFMFFFRSYYAKRFEDYRKEKDQ
ncbi:hypothetical protein [uncultured Kordia sp.]|uniref:hypothetical protein n=1 Tax=uncultured Kordia sp. TaxID=507699 RepID=UPI002630AF8F|nr:hypothetical protein [uncultured Kordia sp.]